MKYRCMYPDTFIEVEAESEEQAQWEAMRKMVVQPEQFIVWPINDSNSNQTTAPRE